MCVCVCVRRVFLITPQRVIVLEHILSHAMVYARQDIWLYYVCMCALVYIVTVHSS